MQRFGGPQSYLVCSMLIGGHCPGRHGHFWAGRWSGFALQPADWNFSMSVHRLRHHRQTTRWRRDTDIGPGRPVPFS